MVDVPGVREPAGLRSRLRDAVTAAAVVLTAPLWLPCRLEGGLTGTARWFEGVAELLSLIPGYPGIVVRRGFFRATLETCAPDVSIGFGTVIAHREVRIGAGVYIGLRCTLGQVALEDHVTVGSNVDILSGRHQHGFDDSGQPIQTQARSFARVRIGRNCWIGNSAVIMADVGDASVIGAGTVVVKPVPPGSVAVGNPSRVVRSR